MLLTIIPNLSNSHKVEASIIIIAVEEVVLLQSNTMLAKNADKQCYTVDILKVL